VLVVISESMTDVNRGTELNNLIARGVILTRQEHEFEPFLVTQALRLWLCFDIKYRSSRSRPSPPFMT
jgi:hypothetical protein